MPTTASHLPSSLQSPKKRHIRWWITGIVILVLLGGGASCYYYLQTLPTPQKTLSAFCNGWITKDAWKMYFQESAAGQEQETIDDLQQLFQGPGGPGSTTRACFADVVKANGSTAVAGVYLSGNRYVQSPFRATLVLENGQWFINSFAVSDNGVVS